MSLEVQGLGASVLVQDLGRPGWAHLGVPRSGALDRPAAALANRLVGNDPSAACLEVLLGGLVVTADAGVWVAVTGAPCPVEVDGRAEAFGGAVRLPAGGRLSLGRPRTGLRSYLAVGGGIDVPPVLGSRSTDTLGRVGPAPVVVGDVLPVGEGGSAPAPLDTPRTPLPGPLRMMPGPRADRVVGDVLDLLEHTPYTVSPDSDRIGLRLVGAPLPLASYGTHEELPSEGVVLGSVQVPPDGRPVVFLADHPTTGGYPVVAVVEEDDLWRCAQLRPGERVELRRAATR
ncbi:MAG: biotin-dependent carboxyltransferase family protein [Nocardioides sp.]